MKYYIAVNDDGHIGVLSRDKLPTASMYEVEFDEEMYNKIASNIGAYVVENDGNEMFLTCIQQNKMDKHVEEDDFSLEVKKNILRERRNNECFEVVNRGELWYSRLTAVQLRELDQWYSEWLQVTDTMTEPQKPSWIK